MYHSYTHMYMWFYCAWGFRQTLCFLDPSPRGQGNTGLFEEVRHSSPEHLPYSFTTETGRDSTKF